MSKQIFISAAEISADQYGAQLAKALWEKDPTLRLVGLGSVHMKEAGVTLLDDIVTTSSVGLIEAVQFLPKIFKTISKIKTYLKENKVDLFIALDAQGFHMQLLPEVKKLGIKTAYFIAPQEWHWGTKAGGRKVVACTDQIFTIFEKESKFYESLGKNITFVGHPLCDFEPHILPKEDFFKVHGFELEKPLMGIFPGSRIQEIDRVGPVVLAAAKYIQEKRPDIQFGLSIADQRYQKDIEALIEKIGVKGIKLMDISHSKSLIKYSKVVLTSSGTVTLEQALIGTPAVVTYKLHPLTYLIGKTVLALRTKNITWISLPNILSNEEIYKEFVQGNANPKKMAKEALLLLENESYYDKVCKKLAHLKANLGEKGVIKRVALGSLKLLESKI